MTRASSRGHRAFAAGLEALGRGALDHAAVAFHRAARDTSPHPDAWHNYATAMLELGRAEECARELTRALARRPAGPAATTLSDLLEYTGLEAVPGAELRGLEAALRAPDADRQPLAQATIVTLALAPPLLRHLARGRAEGWETAARDLLEDREAVGARALHAALEAAVNTHPDLELLLTECRRVLLLEASAEHLAARPWATFVGALVRQGINNEHVHFVSDVESARLHTLHAEWQTGAGDTDDLAARLLLYAHPAELRDAGDGRAHRIGREPLATIVGEELEAHTRGHVLADALPSLGQISDPTSQAVTDQYETHPYPRWLSMTVPRPGSARDALEEHFDEAELAFMNAPFEVLVVGGGTGRHPITAAMAYGPKVRVTSVDLSRSSLGYAARMAERYAVSNLELARADLLELGAWDRRFPVIECVGVLHHLRDPRAGFRVVEGLLEPGGLLRLGLYSAAARTVVTRLRNQARAMGVTPDTEGIRRFRRAQLLGELSGAIADRWRSKAYFSASGCRDLLFHACEHTFDLDRIRGILAELDLEFRGFELDRAAIARFEAHHRGQASLRDLAAWREFEDAHPATFGEMYRFWCRKA